MEKCSDDIEREARGGEKNRELNCPDYEVGCEWQKKTVCKTCHEQEMKARKARYKAEKEEARQLAKREKALKKAIPLEPAGPTLSRAPTGFRSLARSLTAEVKKSETFKFVRSLTNRVAAHQTATWQAQRDADQARQNQRYQGYASDNAYREGQLNSFFQGRAPSPPRTERQRALDRTDEREGNKR
ncbi:hypothetical protein VTL71DRAFT_9335 [Oculimacula yallundae]|uniref:Uncharacterized protein n=1 Tax=Oculimacula yallundae TaxID=86028 RepID=A0ABR4BUH0_9HELO